MFLIAAGGNKMVVAKGDLDEIETYLIHRAAEKNENLRNFKKTKNTLDWVIRGVVNAGKGKAPANAIQFKKMLGI